MSNTVYKIKTSNQLSVVIEVSSILLQSLLFDTNFCKAQLF